MTENAGTLLQAARLQERWSQGRLIVAMKAAAPGLDMHLPETASLKTQLTRWENGHKTPGEDYRRLFRLVYGKTNAELGFPEPALVSYQISDRSFFSTEAVKYFDQMLIEHARADNLLGPRLLIGVVREQAKSLGQVAKEARGPMRPAILEMACRYHEFAGWLLQDLGRVQDAMTYTDRARDLATELTDPLLQVHLLMRKSNIATDGQDAALGAALADAALRSAPHLPPQLHATVLRQRANSYSGLREVSEVEASIGRALDVVQRQEADAPQIASYCTASYVAMEAGNCWLQLGKPSKALSMFESVKNEWPDSVQRDKALSFARLARCHALAGDPSTALTTGHQAVLLASATGSMRTIQELQLLRSGLVRWARDPEVASLRASVAGLVAAAA